MNFLVNKILDDGSVSYGLTGSGYVVLIIVCVLLMTIGCFARDNNSKLNVKHIAFAATATAAAVITSKLGGSAASLTTYTLIANIGAAIAVPILFPLVEVHPDVTFWEAFLVILGKVFPLLICPFLAAWLLSKCLPKVHQKLLGYHELAFYLWAVSLAIVTAQTLYSLLNDPADGFTEIMIAVGALIACCLQFFLGKTIGSIYNDRISGGQALGQKNTILAIWMAHTYLNPLSSVAPGSYVLWQNIINSWQLWKKRKR